MKHVKYSEVWSITNEVRRGVYEKSQRNEKISYNRKYINSIKITVSTVIKLADKVFHYA